MFKLVKKYECGIIRFKIPFHADNRGYFSKLYNHIYLKNIGIDFIPIEHFHSISNKNVLRGLHFQVNNSAHNKIIHCINGSILDVCVDVRHESKFYNQPISFELDKNSNEAIFIPKGFAHGFLSLEDNTLLQYLSDKTHYPQDDKGALWKSIKFNWPIENPILSSRDSSHPDIGLKKWNFF